MQLEILFSLYMKAWFSPNFFFISLLGKKKKKNENNKYDNKAT